MERSVIVESEDEAIYLVEHDRPMTIVLAKIKMHRVKR